MDWLKQQIQLMQDRAAATAVAQQLAKQTAALKAQMAANVKQIKDQISSLAARFK